MMEKKGTQYLQEFLKLDFGFYYFHIENVAIFAAETGIIWQLGKKLSGFL